MSVKLVDTPRSDRRRTHLRGVMIMLVLALGYFLAVAWSTDWAMRQVWR